MAGSCNDINVLHRSTVFDRVVKGEAPIVHYEINGHEYNKPYYLGDGIYPSWPVFVKTIRRPNSEKQKKFAQHQEAIRKDVERAFGVLQSRFAIVRHPARTWSKELIWEVMPACVIMHNMIVEDERDDARLFDQGWEFQSQLIQPIPGQASFQQYIHVLDEMQDRETHIQLQDDLVNHVWVH